MLGKDERGAQIALSLACKDPAARIEGQLTSYQRERPKGIICTSLGVEPGQGTS